MQLFGSPNKSHFQSILLLGMLAFFVAHLTLLSPSSLEEDFSDIRSIKPAEVLGFFQNEPVTLAKNIPAKTPPSYSIRDLEYLSTDSNKAHWRMLARKSYSYDAAQISHGRDAQFFGKSGVVTAKEATFSQQSNVVELYGNVVATFNNGMVVESEYAKIITSENTQILIPTTEFVHGHKPLSKGSKFLFKSFGLSYDDRIGELKLLSQSHMDILTDQPTAIDSDMATYFENRQIMEATMFDTRPLPEQFVKAKQEKLDLKSRKLTVKMEGEQTVQTLNAYGEVEFFDTTDPLHPVRGTGGRAEYFEKKNLLFLMDFPQVYQDSDTITGDIIRYDRTHDTIEVDQSNAFNRK
jgi:lipopolysaccharide transport protein LptA